MKNGAGTAREEASRQFDARRVLASLAVAVLVMAPFLAASWFVHKEEARDEQFETRVMGAEAASLAWTRYITERAHATRQFVSFWENSEAVTLAEFRGYTATLLRDFPGLIRLTVLTPDARVRWTTPPAPFDEDGGALVDPSWRETLGSIRVGDTLTAEARKPVLSPLMPLRDGGSGYLIAAPLHHASAPGVLDGFVVTEVTLSTNVGAVFSEAVASTFTVEVREGEEHAQFGPDLPRGAPSASTYLTTPGNVRALSTRSPTVTAWPTPARHAETQTETVEMLVAMSLVAGFVVGGAAWVQVARRRERRQSRQRIQESEANLRHANESLAGKVRELDAFARMVAHDIKAPLRGIANAATYLEEDLGNDVPPAAREHLLRIHSSASRLREMVDAMLDYASAGGERYPFERVDAGEVAQEAIDDLTGVVASRAASVEVSNEMPMLRAQRIPLKLALENLVANALAHNPRPDPHVRISVEPDDQGRPVFSVEDDGPGVPTQESERIFELFHRGARAGAGTGVGLATVKRIVEGHGGRVWVERSQDLGGAAFRFTLSPEGDGVSGPGSP